MNKIKNRNGFYLLLIIFIFWLIFISYWYTCQLKGFCRDINLVQKNQKNNVVQKKPITEDYPKDNLVAQKKKVIKQKVTCSPYLKKSIVYGRSNDINEVAKLEKFLNENEGENLRVDGVYQKVDKEAVKRFQGKYSQNSIETGNAITKVDGIVGSETLRKINLLYCIKKTKEYFNNQNK